MTRGRVAGVLVLAVVAAAITWFFGVGVLQALAVGGVVAAVGLTWTAIREDVPLNWPVPPVRSEPGARRELSETAWALRARGGVPERTLARARAVARHRLRMLHRLDLDDPADRTAIEAILPPGVVAVLVRERRSEIDLGTFASVLTALETLQPTTERHP
ncbi:hypothetical protein [Curtobacterium luteum]|uniref:hypothetical protein n=1 Tax=Curtobacterium luteum TaxID=33881 RepID=UPI00073770C1|nr:hypothetical protein [Curtobacterium luteum]